MTENRCGECKSCCIAFDIPELDKSQGAPCQHLCAKGCGIYARRPLTCRNFECLWLMQDGDPQFRPDNSGLLCTIRHFHENIGAGIQIVELFQGASATKEGRQWIDTLWSHRFPSSDGRSFRLPQCIVRFSPTLMIGQRPVTWIVDGHEHADAVLHLERRREELRLKFSNSRRNDRCPCGSGLKFKKCHADPLHLVVKTEKWNAL